VVPRRAPTFNDHPGDCGVVMDSNLLRQFEDIEPPKAPVETSAKPNIWDSPLIPVILVATMLAAGFIAIILGR
jgi:hypothetical protein